METTKARFDPCVQQENSATASELTLRPGWGKKRTRQRYRFGTTKKIHDRCENSLARDLPDGKKISRAFRWRWINGWLRRMRLGGGRLHGREDHGDAVKHVNRLVLENCVRMYSQCP